MLTVQSYDKGITNENNVVPKDLVTIGTVAYTSAQCFGMCGFCKDVYLQTVIPFVKVTKYVFRLSVYFCNVDSKM